MQERHFDLLKGARSSSLPWLLSIVSIPLGGWLSTASRPAAASWSAGAPCPSSASRRRGVFLSLGARHDERHPGRPSLALSTASRAVRRRPLLGHDDGDRGATAAGLAGGVMNTGSNVGGLISPALTPVLAAAVGWENALHVAAALSVIGGVLWIAIRPGIGASAPTG